MQSLQTLLDVLGKNSSIHISIWNLSGILNTPLTQIPFSSIIHSTPFCDMAKSTPKGLRSCLRCKALANQRAVKTQKAFAGHCVWGIFEAAAPMILNNEVAAIVYVGNTIVAPAFTESRIRKMCARTAADPTNLLRQAERCEQNTSPEELSAIAEIVTDYLKMLCATAPTPIGETHWLVTQMKHHAEKLDYPELSLRDLARIYHKNETYIGRLFQKEMGVTFHEYRNGLRLARAEKLLANTDRKIIDIALECGFNTVSYFNRRFREARNESPSAYRRRSRK